MALFTKIIDPNGGGDYLSLSAWQAAVKTLYSSGDTAQAICRRTGATKDTTAFTISGWTAGVNIKITVDSNYKHEGKWADTRASDGHYIYVIKTSGDWAATISIAQALVEIDDLLIENTSAYGNGASGISMGAIDGVVIQRCIFKVTNNAFTCGNYGNGSYNLYNCLFYQCGNGYTDGRGDGTSGRYCHVYNCTASECTHYGFKGGYGTNFYNCIGVANTTADFQRDSATPTSDYNISSDATAFGTHNATGKTTYASYFVSKSAGDLHLLGASASVLGLGGTSESGSFTDDIDGTTRSAWDVGYDEYVSGSTTTPKTILGKSRITVATLKTILGKGRITAATLKTILGKAKILVTENLSTNLWGVTFSSGSVTTPKTILGKARIQLSTAKTILGKGRIGLLTLKTIAGKARIALITAKTIQGKADILKATTKIITGKARIGLISAKTIIGKSRIGLVTIKTIKGLARITAQTTKTILGRARITASTLKTILGKSKITSGTQKFILGKSRLTASSIKTILGKGRIGLVSVKTILGHSRIGLITSKIIRGVSRVALQSLKTIDGKARIRLVTQKIILGVAKISSTITSIKTILGKAKISATTNKAIKGLARLQISTAKDIQGKANINMTTNRTIMGMARIYHKPLKAIYVDIKSLQNLVDEISEQGSLEILPKRNSIGVLVLQNQISIEELNNQIDIIKM